MRHGIVYDKMKKGGSTTLFANPNFTNSVDYGKPSLVLSNILFVFICHSSTAPAPTPPMLAGAPITNVVAVTVDPAGTAAGTAGVIIVPQPLATMMAPVIPQ